MPHILITGASSGIGAALAELYAAPNVRLSLHGRDEARLAKIADTARHKGAVVTVAIGDVTDAAGMVAWVTRCEADQPMDLLIANAGISAGSGHGQETPDQSRAIFATNLTGVLNTIQPAIPLMITRRSGQIAIMSSLAGFRGFAGAASYCASKAAVRVYGEALRADLSPYGVRVNVICPGFVQTPMTDVNPFPMPFLMAPDRAARLVQRGLARNHARIAFPWPMAGLVWILATLPTSWAERIARHAPRKIPSAPVQAL